jgi:branched-chain amino acid transport system ATP-binding protein
VRTSPVDLDPALSAPDAMSLRNVEAGYSRDTPIVQGLSASFLAGQVSAIIGANGAGKSTLMKAIVGLVPVYSGQILMNGSDVTGMNPAVLARKGLQYVPQTRDVFGALSVEENLKMGGYVLPTSQVRERVNAVLEILPMLAALRFRRAETLSGGERKMVAVGRALVAEPRVLLVDEPTAGLSPDAGRRVLGEVLPRLSGVGVAVVVVEQRVRDILAMADWCHVLVRGQLVLSSSAADARENDMLATIMLGGTAGGTS